MIGAVDSADIRLKAPHISPIHAVIEVTVGDPAVITVFDLASDSGVYLNGAKVVASALRPGDLLRFGDVELSFDRIEDGSMEGVWPGEEEGEHENIFEQPDPDERSLEVVFSWSGSILDVKHFPWGSDVWLGESRHSDFVVPKLFSKKSFQLLSRAKEGALPRLKLDTGMRGVLKSGGALKPLQSLGESVDFKPGDFAKISVGELDFFLSSTASPPRMRRARVFARDPLFLRVLVSSLLFTAVMIVSLLSFRVDRTVDMEQFTGRIATILYQPEKYSPRIRRAGPADLDSGGLARSGVAGREDSGKDSGSDGRLGTPDLKDAQKDDRKTELALRSGPGAPKQGEGARARGAQGLRGSKNPQPTNKAAGSSLGQKSPKPKNTQSASPGSGNLDALRGAGARIQNLLGGSSSQLRDSAKRVKTIGGFSTPGTEGLALSGGGTGGGGTKNSYGGLGAQGQGLGRVGTGLDAQGTGANLIGGRTRVAIRSGGPEEAVVMGAIDAAAVEAALLAHKDEFRLCYEREINAGNPNLTGRVGTSFVIGTRGRVTRAGVLSSTLRNPNAERCILAVIRRIQFPVPKGGGVVQVNYPFKFRPIGS